MALEVAHPDAWQRSLPSNGTLASTIKRVGKYFRDQATQQSHSALHLAPGNKYEHDQEVRIWSESRNNSEDHVRPSQKPLHLPPGISRPIRSSTSTMSVNSASGPGVFRDMVRHQYAAENILQSYDVLDVRPDSGAFWVVYIHGGYFRDPKVDATSFKPTISALEESTKFEHIKKSIAGYASINYRLAPHPAYPQSPDEPKYTLNSAHWPDQPADVIAALKHLQRTYPASKRYVLVGHSVGATLALLTALKCADAGLSQPCAIGGVSGIYDFPAIHTTNPDYQPITENAIAKECFADASPALHSAEQFSHKWTPQNKRHVLLAHSGDDGLVGLDQPQEMLKVLSGDAFHSKYMELHGEHNEIWEKTELARVVGDVVGMVS